MIENRDEEIEKYSDQGISFSFGHVREDESDENKDPQAAKKSKEEKEKIGGRDAQGQENDRVKREQKLNTWPFLTSMIVASKPTSKILDITPR